VSDKKSYMNQSNLIAEGFFSKLIKQIKDRKTFKKIKSDKKLNKNIDDLNKSTKSLEDRVNGYLRDAGQEPIKLAKFSIKDFI
jgi:flagellar motility protein MotE (MotC chaperone)